MKISKVSLEALAVATVMMAAFGLSGCGGGGGTTATTQPAPAAKSTLSGDVTFPDDATTLAKTTAKTVGLATETVVIDVFTLDNTKVKVGVSTTWKETTKSYSYTVSDLTPGVDYLIRAVKTKADGSKLTCKKLVEKVNVKEGTNTGLAVDTTTTTIVTVVEKKLFDADNTIKVTLGDDTAKLPTGMTPASLSLSINTNIGSVKYFEDQLKGITDTKGNVITANISAAATPELQSLLADLATLHSQVEAATQASIPTHDLIVEKIDAVIVTASAAITGTITQYKTDGTITSVNVSDIKTIAEDSIKPYTPPSTTTPAGLFTSSMLSGKTVTFNGNGGTETLSLKSDGTWTGVRPGNEATLGTWSVDSNGKLVAKYNWSSNPSDGTYETITCTIVSGALPTFSVSYSGLDFDLTTFSGSGTLTINSTTVAPAPITPAPVTPAPVTTFAGAYTGTYSGADSGTVTVTLASNGSITGSGRSTVDTSYQFTISGQVSAGGNVSLKGSGSAGTATFTGTVTALGVLSGTWSDGATGSGTFTTHTTTTGTVPTNTGSIAVGW